MKLLYFTASWCSACRIIAPELANYLPVYETVECDKDQETAIRYHVTGLPTFIVVDDNGTEVARTNTTNLPVLKGWYEQFMNGVQNDSD